MADTRSQSLSPLKQLQKEINGLYDKYQHYKRLDLVFLANNFSHLLSSKSRINKNLEDSLKAIIKFSLEKIAKEYPNSKPDAVYLFYYKLYGSDLYTEFKKLSHYISEKPLHDYECYILIHTLYEYLIQHPKDLTQVVSGLTYTEEALLKDIEEILQILLSRKENKEEILNLTTEIPVNIVLRDKLTDTVAKYRNLTSRDRDKDVNFMDFINLTCDQFAPLYQLDPYIIRKELYFFIMAGIDAETHVWGKGHLYTWCQEDTQLKHSNDFAEKNCLNLIKYIDQYTHIKSQLTCFDESLIDAVDKHLPNIRNRLKIYIPTSHDANAQASIPARMARYATHTLFNYGTNRIVHSPLVSNAGNKVVVSITTTVGMTMAGPGGAVIGACVGTFIAPEVVSLVCHKLIDPISHYAGQVALTFTDNSIKMIFGYGDKNEHTEEYSKDFFNALLKSPQPIVNDKLKLSLLSIYPLTYEEVRIFISLPERLFSTDCKQELCRIHGLNLTDYQVPTTLPGRVMMN